MGSVSARTSITFALLFGAFGPGCIHIHTDEEGRLQSVEMKMTDTMSAKKTTRPTSQENVRQVSAMTSTAAAPMSPTAPTVAMPAPASPPLGARLAALRPLFPRFASFVRQSPPVAEVTTLWQNQIAYLPDPTKNGAPGAGVVGELFLIGTGPRMPFTDADGKVTFTIYDESQGAAASKPLGSWTFDKGTLARLVSVDERLGKCYAIFLPWPDYQPSITRVRLTTRYEPDDGQPLFATTWVNFDNKSGGERSWNAMQSPVPSVIPPAADSSATPATASSSAQMLPAPTPMNVSAGAHMLPLPTPVPAAPTFPPPIPLNGSAPGATSTSTSAHPTELPPLSITLPGKP